METDLARIKVALAVMRNAELDALSKATYKVEQIAPGPLTWLDSACLWQLQRRGYHYELQPPEAAIPLRRMPSALTLQSCCRYLRKGIFNEVIQWLTGAHRRAPRKTSAQSQRDGNHPTFEEGFAMQLVAVAIDKPEATNFILGQTRFIKSREDLHEALVACVPGIHPVPASGSPSGCAPSSAHSPPTY